jgi:hypothetical protein
MHDRRVRVPRYQRCRWLLDGAKHARQNSSTDIQHTFQITPPTSPRLSSYDAIYRVYCFTASHVARSQDNVQQVAKSASRKHVLNTTYLQPGVFVTDETRETRSFSTTAKHPSRAWSRSLYSRIVFIGIIDSNKIVPNACMLLAAPIARLQFIGIIYGFG